MQKYVKNTLLSGYFYYLFSISKKPNILTVLNKINDMVNKALNMIHTTSSFEETLVNALGEEQLFSKKTPAVGITSMR